MYPFKDYLKSKSHIFCTYFHMCCWYIHNIMYIYIVWRLLKRITSSIEKCIRMRIRILSVIGYNKIIWWGYSAVLYYAFLSFLSYNRFIWITFNNISSYAGYLNKSNELKTALYSSNNSYLSLSYNFMPWVNLKINQNVVYYIFSYTTHLSWHLLLLYRTSIRCCLRCVFR